MFLQDTAFKHQENWIQRGHDKAMVIVHFLKLNKV